MKTMPLFEIAKTPKTLGFPGRCVPLKLLSPRLFFVGVTLPLAGAEPLRSLSVQELADEVCGVPRELFGELDLGVVDVLENLDVV